MISDFFIAIFGAYKMLNPQNKLITFAQNNFQ